MPRNKRKPCRNTCDGFCFDGEKVARLRESLPDPGAFRRTSDSIKALGHPGRLAILWSLSAAECCVCELSLIHGLPVSTVSRHLSVLRNAGFVASRQERKLVICSLTSRGSAALGSIGGPVRALEPRPEKFDPLRDRSSGRTALQGRFQ